MHFTGEIVIESNRPWWKPRVGELWAFRDLGMLMVRRDFLSKYRQTVLGPVWYIIQPLITVVVFTVIFGRFAGISTDGLPQFLFYQCGLLGFTFVSHIFTGTATSFTANAGLYGKVYFPRLIPPLATTSIQLVPFALQALSLFGFWIYFRFYTEAGAQLTVTAYAWMLPVILIHLMAIGLGLGLLFSALTAKYRDLSHLVPFLAQIWMYASPVIYPLSKVPEHWLWLATINPAAPIIEWFRLAFLGTGSFSWSHYAVSVAITLFALVIGFLTFQRTERTFVDTV